MSAPTNLTLGSGKLYVKALANETDIGALSTYCTDGNQLGWIQGGCSINYTPSTYDVKDDLGAVSEHFITSETVTMSSGILTWNLDVLEKLINNETTGTIPATSTTGSIDYVEIGGSGLTTMDKYIVVFEAEPDTAGKIRRFGLVGTCDSGLALAYQPSSETAVNVQFNAIAFGTNHKLLRIEEQNPLT